MRIRKQLRLQLLLLNATRIVQHMVIRIQLVLHGVPLIAVMLQTLTIIGIGIVMILKHRRVRRKMRLQELLLLLLLLL